MAIDPQNCGNDPVWQSLVDSIEPRLKTWPSESPFIVGIGGPSGVGKSTVAKRLARTLESRGRRCLVLGLDDFFKTPEAREKLGEWSPEHVRLAEARRVLKALKGGETVIETLRYRRVPRKRLEPWRLSARGIDVVLFEGLYALSRSQNLGRLGELMDLGIYLDADPQDLKRWRFQQELEKPNHRDAEGLERHWREGICPDLHHNIAPTARHADLIFWIDSDHSLRRA